MINHWNIYSGGIGGTIEKAQVRKISQAYHKKKSLTLLEKMREKFQNIEQRIKHRSYIL